MKELSLFTGAGGGILGSMLLGHRIVGAVEIDEYCCRVLEQRQRDGILEPFPIFQTDIRDFIRQGYAELYKGRCDLISGGFPCQPFSVAGKRAGADDERNMWPATVECVRIIRPRYCFFENVVGLLSSGYFGRIVADLAACGYGVRWRVLSAAEVGAPHKRDRLWIVAVAQGSGLLRDRDKRTESRQVWVGDDVDAGGAMGDTAEQGLQNGGSAQVGQSRAQPQPQRPTWWETEPDVGRLADGYAGRVAELKAAGNAQVASVAATAWRLLTEDIAR